MMNRRSFIFGLIATATGDAVAASGTTASTSTSTGALYGGGGVGVAGAIPNYVVLDNDWVQFLLDRWSEQMTHQK
jgi:hypothetical protein